MLPCVRAPVRPADCCRQALKQMGGALRDMYEDWRHQLKGCLAHAEAVIDFGDDEVRSEPP